MHEFLAISLPWFFVATISLLVVMTEIFTTFKRDFITALVNRWTWLLILLNILVALGVYSFCRDVFGLSNSVGDAAVVGFLFPVAIRSRFTMFQARDDDDGILGALSLKFDEYYTKIQGFCWEFVDNDIAENRARQAEIIAQKYSDENIIRIINQKIHARQIEIYRERDLKLLGEIQNLPESDVRRFRLAMMLIDLSSNQSKHLIP